MTLLALSLTFVVAACSLLYELTIAQTVSLFAYNNVVWYSLVVGIFIGAMGLGAFFSSRMFRGGALWERLVWLEIILALTGGLAAVVIHGGQAWGALLISHGQPAWGSVAFFAIAFVVASTVGILSGAELPLLIELAESGSPGKDRSARVIALDYFGSLAGAVLFPVLFVPRLDMLELSWLVALANLAAAAVLAWRFRSAGGVNYSVFLTVGAGVFVVLLLAAAPVRQYFLKAYYYYDYPKEELRQDVAHSLTPYQSVDIVQLGAERNSAVPRILAAYSRKYSRQPDLPRGFALYLNRDFQFYSDVEEIYHETFAHVPVAAAGKVPRKVLIMGGGDGLLLREIVKYPGVERVVQVEIDPGVVGLFRANPALRALSGASYDDRRLQLVFDDAYHYLRRSAETFDAIYLDFPAPSDFGLSRLYSREFYSMVRRHLSADGFAVVNTPGLAEGFRSTEGLRTWHVVSNTLEAAGFGEVRPFFSLLEDNNPQALDIMQRELKAADDSAMSAEELAGAARENLRDVLGNLVSGFIFVQPVAGDIAPEYVERAVGLDVMNGQRYALATTEFADFQRKKEPRSVNSILRPILPDLAEWWKLRTPY